MTASKAAYHLEQSKRLVTILRMTIDRRFPPDEAIENAITAIECELMLLARNLKKEEEVNGNSV